MDFKPGIYYDLPDAEYRAIPAWCPSTVVSGLVSMLQLHHDMSHPKAKTKAMIFGSAIHTAILEPDLFPMRYVIWDGNRKDGKVWDAFYDANAGKTVLSDDEYHSCLGARDAVARHPAAKRMLAGAKTEVSILWRDTETDLPCKGRADLVGNALLGCIKSTTLSVADDRALKRVASQFHYDMRMAAYHAGLSMFGDSLPVKLAFVEQKPPHDVRVKTLSLPTLAAGWDRWMSVLSRIPECERTGIWPGCDDGESEIEFWGGDSLDITLDGESV